MYSFFFSDRQIYRSNIHKSNPSIARLCQSRHICSPGRTQKAFVSYDHRFPPRHNSRIRHDSGRDQSRNFFSFAGSVLVSRRELLLL